MKSMTGYGRGQSSLGGRQVVVELSSVNRRQAEITVVLPRELESLESRVRDRVARRVSRGRLLVKASLANLGNHEVENVQINLPLARAYLNEFRKLAAGLNIENTVSLDLLLRAPGILKNAEESGVGERIWPVLERALDAAVAELVRMREREGAHLARDLRGRIRSMRQSVARIAKAAPAMVERFREQLRLRIANAGLDLPAEEDERLLKEVIYFADRSDITEELTRLRSHFKQFDECVKSDEPVGRTLDFLAQEMNREINTIGSKAADSAISREVVQLKAELERFREQVQNVE